MEDSDISVGQDNRAVISREETMPSPMPMRPPVTLMTMASMIAEGTHADVAYSPGPAH